MNHADHVRLIAPGVPAYAGGRWVDFGAATGAFTLALRRWRSYLAPSGRLIVVEYDTDRGNHWAPHALAFETFSALAQAAGFTAPERIGTQPSRFLGRFFAGLALARAGDTP